MEVLELHHGLMKEELKKTKENEKKQKLQQRLMH
jgi:hypothetical protein